MRRSSLVALVLLVVLAVSPAAAQAVTDTAQYPDLRTLPPRDLMLDRTDVSVTGTEGIMHNVLRFSNTVYNDGDGPLMIQGIFATDPENAPAVQHLYDASGNDVGSHEVGMYTWHQAHQHFHFVDWGRYELWTAAKYDAWVNAGRPDTMAPDLAGQKTTSCIEDEEFIASLPNASWPGFYQASGCGHGEGTVMTQGLSVGWGDTYDYYRQDQWIDLDQSTLADGAYVLRSVADPFNRIYESSGKADPDRESVTANDAITRFRISGGQLVDGVPPSGTVFVNGTDKTTPSSQVTVRLIGRDDVTGVDQVRVSNDGQTWKTMPYGGDGSVPMTLTWDLADSRYGGTSTGGTRTVYAQFHDRAGNWSQSEKDTIDYTGGGSAPPPVPPSAYADAVRADAPVSWWRLGETAGPVARDQMGTNDANYGLSATVGAPGLLASDGDRGVRVDGHSGVDAQSATGLAPGAAFSVEAWIRPEVIPAAGQWASVVTRTDAYSIQFNGPKLEWTVIQNGARRRLQAAAGAVQAGHTYHVVGSYDGTTQRLYLDGVQIGTAAVSGPVDTGSGLHIGSWDGGSEAFTGTIDEVAFYNTALPGLQVKRHHDAGVATAAGVATPTGLTAATSATDRVDLSWADNATNETGYVLERATSADFAGAQRITLPSGTTSYADTGRAAGTTYFYRVQGVSGTDSSAWSNTASATTQSPPPQQPPTDTTTTPTTTTPTTTTPTTTTPTTTTPTDPAPPAYAPAVLADAPLGYWRLDETTGTTARDQRKIRNGTYVGGPRLGVAPLLAGGDGRAVGLDGVNDRVTVPSSSGFSFGRAFTLEAWVRPDWLPAAGSFASVVTRPESYSLQLNGGRMEFTVIQSGERRRLQAPVGAIVPGGTYHVVATYNGSRQRLYVNGAEVASRIQSGAASAVPAALEIGSWDGTGEFLGGTVDEVAVYARTLTADQVRAHYDAGGPGTTSVAAASLRAHVTRRRTKPAQARTRRAVLRARHRKTR